MAVTPEHIKNERRRRGLEWQRDDRGVLQLRHVKHLEVDGAMGIERTAEAWVRIDLICDGLGDNGICLADPGDELERISDVAPTEEGARKAILNAAVKAGWRLDPKLQRWLCPDCVRARDELGRTEEVAMTDGPPAVPQRSPFLEEALVD